MQCDGDEDDFGAMDFQADNRGVHGNMPNLSQESGTDGWATDTTCNTLYSRTLKDLEDYEKTSLFFLLGTQKLDPPQELLIEALAISGNFRKIRMEFGLQKQEVLERYRPRDPHFTIKVDPFLKKLFLIAESLNPAETEALIERFDLQEKALLGQQLQLELHFECWMNLQSKENLTLKLKKILADMQKGKLCHQVLKEVVDDSDGFYKLNSKNVGRCIIINQKLYKEGGKLESRRGTDLDCARLEEIFTMRGYIVVVYKNVKLSRMKEILVKESGEIEEDCSSLVVCILAHGDKNVIYCTDGEKYPIEDMEKCFYASKCRALAGKPKLFFVQACQGTETLSVASPSPRSVRGGVKADNGPQGGAKKSKEDVNDFFIFNAAFPGTSALRHMREGTFFVKALCSSLCLPKQSYFLHDIELNVKKLVNGMTAEIGGKNCSMAPVSQNTLIKKVRFDCNEEWAKEAMKMRLRRLLNSMIIEKIVEKVVRDELTKK